ncbi:MAG: mechanosensitive ion channel family protein [Cyanobacteriota bacterium]|nr:mechanosensitive ion channel family protein [Cyanobacteriota bacterium]
MPLICAMFQLIRPLVGRRSHFVWCAGITVLVSLAWGLGQAFAQPEATAAVTLGDRPLFTIQARQSFPSVAERAQRISARLEAAAQDQTVGLDQLSLSETEFGPTLYAMDHLLMTVSQADAEGTGLSPQILAKQHLSTIQQAMGQYRQERSAEALGQAALIAFLCTLGLTLTILVLANVMPQFYRWLDRQQDRWVPNIRFYNVEILTASQLTTGVQVFTRILHTALVLLLLLLYFSYVLGLFPATRKIGQGIFGYGGRALQAIADRFLNYLPNLLTIALILMVVTVVLRVARWLFNNLRRRRLTIEGFYPEWAIPTYRLVQFLTLAFALAVVFPYLPGANSPAFQGVSIFFGLLVSLGAGGAILSVVAGFILIYTRAFVEGDRIHFGDVEGFVVEKSLFVTRLRTIENILVSVPNVALLSSNITNYSALVREDQTPLILTTTVTLGYDVPWRLVHDTLIAAAQDTSHILTDPSPSVWQTSLDDFYVSYQLRAHTIHPELLGEIGSELCQHVQDRCNQAGIEILSPHYGAIRDGNTSTIPATYLPANYQPPFWNLPPRSQ